MSTALVRMKSDKQIVGMFVYKNEKDLFWLVDQATDPYDCEYVDIDHGGLIWLGQSEKLVDDEYQKWVDESEDEDAPHEMIFNNASIDEYAYDRVVANEWIDVTNEEMGYYR